MTEKNINNDRWCAYFLRVIQGGNCIWADTELSWKQVREQLISGTKNNKNKFTSMVINLLLIKRSKDIRSNKVVSWE